MEDKIIYCTRCGSPMKSDARYCMKCGNLNYDHPDNKNMVSYATDEGKQVYEIGSGLSLNNKKVLENSFEQATNTGSEKVFLFINLLWLIFSYGLILFTGFTLVISFKNVFYLFVLLSLLNIYVISFEIIFMKANQRWWLVFVPIYNLVILSKIVFDRGWLTILFFVPVVNVLYLLAIFYKLGKLFDKSPIFTMLLSLIYLPVIAFGGSMYKRTLYLNDRVKDETEKGHRVNRGILTLILVFLAAGVLGSILVNFPSINVMVKNFDNQKIINIAQRMINKVDRKISQDKFECSDGTKILPNSTHYFVFYDVISDLGLFSLDTKKYVGYVKVYNNGQGMEYSVSISDGNLGLLETSKDQLSLDKLIQIENVNDFENNLKCYVN